MQQSHLELQNTVAWCVVFLHWLKTHYQYDCIAV